MKFSTVQRWQVWVCYFHPPSSQRRDNQSVVLLLSNLIGSIVMTSSCRLWHRSSLCKKGGLGNGVGGQAGGASASHPLSNAPEEALMSRCMKNISMKKVSLTPSSQDWVEGRRPGVRNNWQMKKRKDDDDRLDLVLRTYVQALGLSILLSRSVSANFGF